jgi:hypothetical protein
MTTKGTDALYMNDNPSPPRVYVGVTIDEMRLSIQAIPDTEARRLAETHSLGKWVEQDVFFVDSSTFGDVSKCRFKTNETDTLENLYAGFAPQYHQQIKNWKSEEKVRVRGRITRVGWYVLLEDCEVVS